MYLGQVVKVKQALSTLETVTVIIDERDATQLAALEEDAQLSIEPAQIRRSKASQEVRVTFVVFLSPFDASSLSLLDLLLSLTFSLLFLPPQELRQLPRRRRDRRHSLYGPKRFERCELDSFDGIVRDWIFEGEFGPALFSTALIELINLPFLYIELQQD